MRTGRLWVLCLFLVLAAVVRAEFQPAQVAARSRTLKSFPAVIDQWSGVDAPRLDERTLAVLGADDYLNRVYRSSSHPINLFVGYYRSQAQGDAIHSPLNCLPGSGWEPVDRSRMNVTIASPAPPLIGTIFGVNRLTIQKGEDRQLVLYWYQTRSRVTANEYWNKFFLVTDAVSTGRTDAALVRLISPIERGWSSDDTDVAPETATFARAVLPIVNLWLFQ